LFTFQTFILAALCSWALNNNNNNNNNAAASKKMNRYTSLAADHHFQPIAVETFGPSNQSASRFLSLLAKKKISQQSGDERETVFCFGAFLCIGATI